MSKKYLLLLLLLAACTMHAQYWAQQHYTVENGLPDNYVFAFSTFQDELYVATDGGLAVFDGSNFQIRHKKEIRYPVALLNVQDSIFYISSWLDGIIEKNDTIFQNKYPSRVNRILHYKDKTLIYNVYQRLAYLSFTKNREIDTLIALDSVNLDRRTAIDDTHIYISEGIQIKRFTWEGVFNYSFTHGMSSDVQTMKVIDNHLFLGDANGNLVWKPNNRFAEENRYTFEKPFGIERIVPYNTHQILVQLKQRAEHNRIYLVTFSDNFSKVLRTEELLNIRNGVSDLYVHGETIYLAAYGNGFYQLFPSKIRSYHKDEYQIPIPKFSYENDEGEMVFATENISYTLRERDTFTQQKNPVRLNTIIEYGGKRYFSSHENLYDESQKTVGNSRVDKILKASKNDTLFYSKYWFSRYKNNWREDIFCIEYNKRSKKINCGTIYNNGAYIGVQNGIKKFINNAVDVWQYEKDSLLESYFNQRVIKHLVNYKNQLIIATPYEVFTYNGTNIKPIHFSETDVYINAVFVDKKERLYIGTNKGFWVLTTNDSYHFNASNGTNSDNIYSFYEDSKGIIWMISGNGIMEFDPEQLQRTKPPKIEILQPKITDDQAIIHFKSDVFQFPESVLYEYNVNNAEWKKTSDRTVEMSNLKPGTYQVAFRAKRLNSEWSAPSQLQFTILPKWYQLTAIKILVFLLLTLLLISLLWYRLRVIKKRNMTLSSEINKRIFLEHKVANLREEIARDFHDEIGNKIASVIGLSNLLKHQKERSVAKIDKIEQLSKEMYHTTKDFVWSLDPNNNNLESLCLYLRDYGENFFDLFEDIDFLYTEINIKPIAISYVKSRNIILAYKEILTNIIKHSEANVVVLKVFQEEATFTLQIKDNGIGIHQNPSAGNGLKNIKKRMEAINAAMQITQNDGVAYTFVISLAEEEKLDTKA